MSPAEAMTSYSGNHAGSLGQNAWVLGWNLNPRTPASMSSVASRTASLPLWGSTDPNGMSTSGLARAASRTSELPSRRRPMPASSSTLKMTAMRLRSR